VTQDNQFRDKELPKGVPVSEAKEIKRNRARHACKPDLQRLFDLVNLIPPDQEMECPYLQGARNLLIRPGSRKWVEEERRKYEAFEEYLESFPKGFQAYIRYSTSDELDEVIREMNELAQPMSDTDDAAFEKRLVGILSKQIDLYERIRAIRKDLYRFTEIGENAEKYLGQQLDIALGVLLVEHAYLDKEGRLRRQPNPYAELMDGVEVSRIRACLICKKLFWATRKDKKCCSEEHSAIIRQRHSRSNKEKNTELYAKSAKLRKQKQKGKRSVALTDRYNQKGE
jgi:hypothetical protein